MLKKIVGFFENRKKRAEDIENAKNYIPHIDSALEVKNLNFWYGEKKVIEDFTFEFKKNKIYTILGASGSGKSTIASHFNGLLKSPTANIYLWNGENIYSFNKKLHNFREIRKEVGMVLQNPEYQLFKETVLEDVCCGLYMLKPEMDNKEQRGKDKLKELGINEELFERNPFMLSGGQKKKIALAGILVIEPGIVIFDEPILGLDPHSSSKIVEIIYDLQKKGSTVIVISNNIDFLLEVGDEILVIENGKLIKHGKPYAIFRDVSINLGVPQIIRFIQNLTSKSSKYESIWDDEPRNTDQLAKSILNAISK